MIFDVVVDNDDGGGGDVDPFGMMEEVRRCQLSPTKR